MKRLHKTKMKINGQQVVFHGSTVPNLKNITPSKDINHLFCVRTERNLLFLKKDYLIKEKTNEKSTWI